MSDRKIKILVLTADPPTLKPLQLGKEVREITANVREAAHGVLFEVVPEFAVRRRDLIKLLRRHGPAVVHFSGHGSEEGSIFLVSDDDKPLPLNAEALKMIFAEFKDSVQLVFLNACYTRVEVEAIAQEIDCAVGTEAGISDRAAITFAATFYNELASGSTVGKAFNLGKAQLKGEGLETEAKINVFAKQGVDYHQVRFVGPQSPTDIIEKNAKPEVQTETTGRVYVSYAPASIAETLLIASAMRDRGIPLCEEALDPNLRLTDDAITDVLRSPGTASGLLSLTRAAVDSRSVTNIELPMMLERIRHSSGFYVAAAALSNFDLGDTGACLRSNRVPVLIVPEERPSATEVAKIARLVLEKRIAAIHESLEPSEPLSLELYTRVRPAFKPGSALVLDWTERFQRYATPEAWEQYLLPALRDVVQALERHAPGRAIQADGRPSLPAAIGLGCGFIQPKNIRVRWVQHTNGRRDQYWGIDVARKDCGLTLETSAHQPDGADLAVLVSAIPRSYSRLEDAVWNGNDCQRQPGG